MPHVTFITTTHHNVGDDFVREGIVYLISKILGPFNSSFIHKHLPITARPEFDWIHEKRFDRLFSRKHPFAMLKYTNAIDSLPLRPATDKVLQCDILVQSGAPIFWSNRGGDCSQVEWWNPLIERRWLKRRTTGLFLNIAGGTCQHYHSDGSEILANEALGVFIQRFFDLAALTTVRDTLSAKILTALERKVELLPCTSIFVADKLKITPKPGEYIALNFMPGGGHYDFEGNIDASRWERVFTQFARRLVRKTPCRLICHSRSELAVARKILPDIPHLFSENHVEILRYYAEAKFGIVNRVHGAFALASLGKPAAVIGADTRALMASQIYAPNIFVNDVNDEWLDSQVDSLDFNTRHFRDRAQSLKEHTEKRYLDLLSNVLGSKN